MCLSQTVHLMGSDYVHGIALSILYMLFNLTYEISSTFIFLAVLCIMWDLVPQPGIEPASPALGVQSLSHWTTREVPDK